MNIKSIPKELKPISVNYSLDGTTISETLPIASVGFDDDLQPYKDAIAAIRALPIDELKAQIIALTPASQQETPGEEAKLPATE